MRTTRRDFAAKKIGRARGKEGLSFFLALLLSARILGCGRAFLKGREMPAQPPVPPAEPSFSHT